MKIKKYTTGDNDSLEDAIIAITNMKTEDGKHIDFKMGLLLVNEYAVERDRAIKELMNNFTINKE